MTRTRRTGRAPVGAGLRALIDYLVSEPAHAHLSLVDTFAASPDAIEIRDSALNSFAAYLKPGYRARRRATAGCRAIATEAITGGVWQILHDYVDSGRISELDRRSRPRSVYLALVPFLGSGSGAPEAVS